MNVHKQWMCRDQITSTIYTSYTFNIILGIFEFKHKIAMLYSNTQKSPIYYNYYITIDTLVLNRGEVMFL